MSCTVWNLFEILSSAHDPEEHRIGDEETGGWHPKEITAEKHLNEDRDYQRLFLS